MMKRMQTRHRKAIEATTRIQVRKEIALKRKDLSRWMFGPYCLKVPRLTDQMFPDIPFPSSHSEPYDPEMNPPIEMNERVYGQDLYGEMIPQREVQVDSSSVLNKTKNVSLMLDLGVTLMTPTAGQSFSMLAMWPLWLDVGLRKAECLPRRTAVMQCSLGFPISWLLLLDGVWCNTCERDCLL